jgi:Rieske Fe-S protein
LLARRRHRPGAVLGRVHPVADVAPGEGRIVGRPGDQTAVYRDPQGEVHAVSARCINLGCIVSWNPAESSWDCPCHGSRFSLDSEVIQGPAVRNLEKKTGTHSRAVRRKESRR